MGLLDGKAAIVTGSARGIGRATAEMFASEGAKVLINDLDADVAEQASGEINGETAVHAGDLTQPEAADKLVAAGIDAFGAIDIVVNNAGFDLGADVASLQASPMGKPIYLELDYETAFEYQMMMSPTP